MKTTKQKILITSIVRNRADKLPLYFKQIERFVKRLQDTHEFSITIYENDSTDDSKKILREYDYSLFAEKFIQSEDIGTEYFGSVKSDQRVINYANARNRALDPVNISDYRWLLNIEPDIVYTTEMIEEFINQKELSITPDIYSGVLCMNNQAYDLWGMRRTKHEEWGNVFPDFKSNPIREFWSTANGVTLYNTEPFVKGLKWEAYNKRLKKYDCDTAVICEDFRKMGFTKIMVHQLIHLLHVR